MILRGSSPEPPPGSPWDDPIDRAVLVFVDCEMTGLNASADRLIEFCAERCVGGTVDARINTLLRPETGVHGNTHIHGIERADLEGAPTFADEADRITRVLDGGVLVAHAASWDVAFLEAEFARAGKPRRLPHSLDTLTLSRRAFALQSHALASLCETLHIDRGRAHRAGDDVRALRAVWEHLLPPLAPRTPRDLWHVRIGQRHARPDIVAAALAAAEHGFTARVRYRSSRRAPEELLFRVLAVRTDLDPPRVVGYVLPSRSRRELRTDRILAIEQA